MTLFYDFILEDFIVLEKIKVLVNFLIAKENNRKRKESQIFKTNLFL